MTQVGPLGYRKQIQELLGKFFLIFLGSFQKLPSLTFPRCCCPDARPGVTVIILSAWRWSWHRRQSQLCRRPMESQPLDLYHLEMGSTSDFPVERVNQLPCYWGKIKLGFLWLTVTCKVKWSHGGNKPLAGAEHLVLFPALPPRGCVTISKSLHLSETHLPHLKRRACWTRSVVLNDGWFHSHKRYLGKCRALFIITVSVETRLALTEWAGMPNVHNAWRDPNKENPFPPKCLLRYCWMFLLLFNHSCDSGSFLPFSRFLLSYFCHLLVPFWLPIWSLYISVSLFRSQGQHPSESAQESARNSVSWAQTVTYQISIDIPRWLVCSLLYMFLYLTRPQNAKI